MTTDNGPDDNIQKLGGKDQRPYATLDLKAEHVASGETEATEAAGAPEALNPSPESPAQDDAPPPARNGGFYGFATHIGAGALGGVLALVLGYLVYGREPSVPTAEDVAALRSDIAKTGEKLAGFEGQLRDAAQKAAQPGAPSADTAGLKKQISDLSDRVAQIEARPGAAAISQEAVQQSLDPLAARLSELETRVASLAKAQSEIQTSSKATALALALYNLRRAANEGRPFAEN